MKVALVHDYLTQLGGAEKVLYNFQRVFPESPIFVLINDKRKTAFTFPIEKVKTSWLQYFPLSVKNYQWYLTLMPLAIESYKLDNYDVILSSTSSIAKGIKVGPQSLHICYCHTPPRYLWHGARSYIEELSYNRFIKKIIPLFLARLRNWDLLAAQRVDYFIANSRVVQARIRKYYGRESKIIYPPVETEKFYISDKIDDYYLIGGRLVPYKKYDLAIQAFNKLNIKLKIFGSGPDYPRLKKMARSNIEFLGGINDSEKTELYSHAMAFIHPQVEDFGITAVESMAAGRPVIAYREGGALETVLPDVTGEFFDEQNWESLANQLIHFNPEKYNPELIKAHAAKFNKIRFQQEIKDYIQNLAHDFEIQRVFRMK
jgi:glycosyltransferase involved in cell wall biosynthesis